MVESRTVAPTMLGGEWRDVFADSQTETEFDRLVAATIRVGGLSLLTLSAVLLVLRRAAGALAQPLSPASLLFAGCGLAIGALVVRQYVVSDRTTEMRTVGGWGLVLWPSAAAWLAAWAVWLPATSAAGLWCLLAPLMIEEGGSLLVVLIRRRYAGTSTDIAPAVGTRRADLRQRAPLPGLRMPVGVWQQMTRSRRADGRDQCRGQVRAMFAAGQRTEIVHLAFCPPFAGQPQWSAAPVEGPPLSIKQVQVLPHGVRLELRLDQVPRVASAAVVRFAATERQATQVTERPATQAAG
ncbi:MAG: hypothetical protein K8T25_23205 [Planctomycetia bacterium]|nr:hypothetical protein [Planctomycetia bacterium]